MPPSPEKERSDDEFAWKVLCELGGAERHFNELQAKYRMLASTWLLASIGAIGFLLSKELTTKIPAEVMVLGVAVAASFGVFLLWILDLRVYHRLLDANFISAIAIEKAHPRLPQVRRQMRASMRTGEVIHRVMWYYIGAIAAPPLFAGAVYCNWCLQEFGAGVAILAATIIMFAICAVSAYLFIQSPHLKPELAEKARGGDAAEQLREPAPPSGSN